MSDSSAEDGFVGVVLFAGILRLGLHLRAKTLRLRQRPELGRDGAAPFEDGLEGSTVGLAALSETRDDVMRNDYPVSVHAVLRILVGEAEVHVPDRVNLRRRGISRRAALKSRGLKIHVLVIRYDGISDPDFSPRAEAFEKSVLQRGLANVRRLRLPRHKIMRPHWRFGRQHEVHPEFLAGTEGELQLSSRIFHEEIEI